MLIALDCLFLFLGVSYGTSKNHARDKRELAYNCSVEAFWQLGLQLSEFESQQFLDAQNRYVHGLGCCICKGQVGFEQMRDCIRDLLLVCVPDTPMGYTAHVYNLIVSAVARHRNLHIF